MRVFWTYRFNIRIFKGDFLKMYVSYRTVRDTTDEIMGHMWCDLGKPVTCRKRWNCKIKEINITIVMFFFIFHSLWMLVTFDTSVRRGPSKKFWKENNSNFHMISITQNTNFAPCDGFSQITSHILKLLIFFNDNFH